MSDPNCPKCVEDIKNGAERCRCLNCHGHPSEDKPMSELEQLKHDFDPGILLSDEEGQETFSEGMNSAYALGQKDLKEKILKAIPEIDSMGCMEERCKNRTCNLCTQSDIRKIVIKIEV